VTALQAFGRSFVTGFLATTGLLVLLLAALGAALDACGPAPRSFEVDPPPVRVRAP
jgi:hypothetical protein